MASFAGHFHNECGIMKTSVEFEFPDDFQRALEFFEATEVIESVFGIEFSCGDGLFLSDIEDDPDLLEKYDGKVDIELARKDGKLMSRFVASLRYDDSPGAKEVFSKVKVKAVSSKESIKRRSAKCD